jgi:CheY-like chemotaxis protein
MGNLLHNAAKFTPKGGRIRVGVRWTAPPCASRCRTTASASPPTTCRASSACSPRPRCRRTARRKAWASACRWSRACSRCTAAAARRKPRHRHGQHLHGRAAGAAHQRRRMRRRRRGRGRGAGRAACRVLLVDDNVDAMEMMGFLLAEMGHETWTTLGRRADRRAGAGAPAAGDRARHRPAGRGRLPAGAHDQARNPQLTHIRLVAHTGYGSPEDRRRAQEAGFDAHLVKPAELDDLEKALQG